MGPVPASEPAWYAGRQCESGACVEVGTLDDVVMMRSSQAPDVVLPITRAEWREFLAGAKEGLFDDL